MSEIDLAALRALAEKATPGPWERDEWGKIIPASASRLDGPLSLTGVSLAMGNDRHFLQKAENNAAYIAAAHPASVLGLITAAERVPVLEAEVARLREALEFVQHGIKSGAIKGQPVLDMATGSVVPLQARIVAALEPRA